MPNKTITVTPGTGATINTFPDVGQQAKADSVPVVLANDQFVPVVGNTDIVSASFNRPANTTAYATGQLIANNTSVASVVIPVFTAARLNGGTGVIRRIGLKKSSTLLTNAMFRVHLFRALPTLLVGDAGVFAANCTESGYLGPWNVVMDQQFSDGAKGFGAPPITADAIFKAAGGSQSIYGLIEARGPYVPASAELFTIEPELMKD